MASIFWDSQGVIISDYLYQGRTINGAYNAGEWRWLRQEIARKRRGKLTLAALAGKPPVHTSQVAATECGFEIIHHPPYSPDMTPDFYLFPKLKSHLSGTLYGRNEGVIEAVNEYLRDQEKG